MAAGYGISITATDNATAAINRINAALTRMQAPVARLGAATRQLADRTGLSRLAVGFQHAADGARMLGDRLSAVLPMFGVLTGAATAAGMARLITQWADFGQNIGRASDRLAISARSLGQWQVGARLAGASAQSMTSGLTSLRDTLTDAVGGRNNEAVNYLNLLGVRFRDAGGRARDFEEVLPDLADRIQRLRDPTLQARVATVFFGSAAEDLLPILRQGAEGIRRMREEGAANSRTTDEQVARARELGRAWRGLEVGANQAGNAIAAALAPALTPLLERLTRWLTASDGFSGWIERMATGIDRWVQGGGVTRLGDQIAHVAEVADRVAQAFGGWEVAIGALAVALTARLLLPLGRVALTLTSIAGVQLPGWLLGVLGTTAGGVAAFGGAAAYGITRMGEAYRESGAGTPEAQAERRRLWRERGTMGGMPGAEAGAGGPTTSDIAGQVANRLSGLFRQRMGGGGAAPASATVPLAVPGDPSLPRGLRNNNPLNLSFHNAQLANNPGLRSDGRFGIYPTMEAGIAQSVRQMQLHGSRGDNTLARLVSRWAPPNENDTAGYIARVSRETGLGPNDTLDLTNSDVLRRLVGSMTAVENGRRLAPDVIERGVGMALGQPVAGPSSAAAAPGGTVSVDVNIRGAGPQTTADVRTAGNVDARPPRVERAMPGIDTP